MSAALRAIPPAIIDLLRAGQGVFTLDEAEYRGISADHVQRLVKAGLLERVGRGAFASRAALTRTDPWNAHRLRARGFVAARRELTLVAGWSAVAVRGLPTVGEPPRMPTAIRPVPAGRGSTRTRYGVLRLTRIAPEHRARHAGCPIVGAAWMTADLGRYAERAPALIVADAVLAKGTSKAGLRRALAAMAGWPGAERATWVVDHADGRAESALETLGRLSCIEYELPVPLSNVWVGPGYPMYRVDHLWPWHWVVAEGDGALKYRGVDDPAAVVAREKERQWLLQRQLGLDVVRYDWALAAQRRDRLAGRFRQVVAANPPRSEPVQWWPDG